MIGLIWFTCILLYLAVGGIVLGAFTEEAIDSNDFGGAEVAIILCWPIVLLVMAAMFIAAKVQLIKRRRRAKKTRGEGGS